VKVSGRGFATFCRDVKLRGWIWLTAGLPVALKHKRGICLRESVCLRDICCCPHDETFHHDGHQSFGGAVINLESLSDRYVEKAYEERARKSIDRGFW
jgi:hypothetical protein